MCSTMLDVVLSMTVTEYKDLDEDDESCGVRWPTFVSSKLVCRYVTSSKTVDGRDGRYLWKGGRRRPRQ